MLFFMVFFYYVYIFLCVHFERLNSIVKLTSTFFLVCSENWNTLLFFDNLWLCCYAKRNELERLKKYIDRGILRGATRKIDKEKPKNIFLRVNLNVHTFEPPLAMGIFLDFWIVSLDLTLFHVPAHLLNNWHFNWSR